MEIYVLLSNLVFSPLETNMWYTYVLQSKKDSKYYTGSTGNIRKRLKKHEEGRVVSTRERLPISLVYCEICNNQGDAYVREKYLKTGMGKRYIRNRIKRFLSLTGCIC
jgi:putative endonuclease